MKKRLLAIQLCWFLATGACFALGLRPGPGVVPSAGIFPSCHNTGYYAFASVTEDDLIKRAVFEASHPGSRVITTKKILGVLGAADIVKYLIIQTNEIDERLLSFQQLVGADGYEQKELIVAKMGSIIPSRDLDTEIKFTYQGIDGHPYTKRVILGRRTEEDLTMGDGAPHLF